MKVILQKAIPKLGKKDEIIEVNQGYALNALFPKKYAIPATDEAIALLKRKQQNLIAEKTIQYNLLDRAIKTLDGQQIVLSVKTNEKGGLFSKLDRKDVAVFLQNKHRIILDEKCITIPNTYIKEVGTYDITISDNDYTVVLPLTIAAL